MHISGKAIGGGAALLVVAVAAGLLRLRAPDQTLRDQATRQREIATRLLGESLARQFPAGKAIIVSNPFVQLAGQPEAIRRFEEAAIRGLKRGWGDRIQLLGVLQPELRPEALTNPESVPMDPETKTPLSFLQTERAWDDLLRAQPEADVLVSLIGVPANLAVLDVWRRPKPALALLLPDLRMLGGWDAVALGVKSGKLAAIVMARPGRPPESAAPEKDYRAEFDRRFLLITPENVELVRDAYPGLF